jgi:Protein of unknown function (DUF664)
LAYSWAAGSASPDREVPKLIPIGNAISPSTTSRSGGGAGCAPITDLQTSGAASETAADDEAIPGPEDNDGVEGPAAEGRPDLPGEVQAVNNSTRHSPATTRLSLNHSTPVMHPLSQDPDHQIYPQLGQIRPLTSLTCERPAQSLCAARLAQKLGTPGQEFTTTAMNRIRCGRRTSGMRISLLGMIDHSAVNTTIEEQSLTADEVETLPFALDRSRAPFAWKCGGLDATDLRHRFPPSTMTLGGLLKHMALVEQR